MTLLFEHTRRPVLAAALSTAVLMVCASSCAVQQDRQHPNQLTSDLRVLAIRSIPAEIPWGQSAEIAALVYAPAETPCGSAAEVTYEWSWCPARGGSEEAFECLMTEQEAQDLWEQMGGEGEVPPFDLGTDEVAEFTNVLGDYAVAVCEASGVDGEGSELAFYNCLESLRPSVRLVARHCGQEAIAIKDLFPMGAAESEDSDYVPNENPTMTGTIQFSETGTNDDVPEGEPLRINQTYWMNLEIEEDECEDTDSDNCVSELFTPSDDSEERRETLVLSWYMSKGHTSPETLDGQEYMPDSGTNQGQQTYYVEGRETIEPLLVNLLDLTDESPGDAEVFLVLRDERGGVDWLRIPFVAEAE